MRHISFLLLLTILFASCKKDSRVDNPPTGEPGLVTPIGTPAGSITTKTIDAAGGIISTPDNSLTIEIPAGALTSSQSISIQPITTTNRAGLGMSYRLTPHDLVFSKPVKITFTYTDALVESTLPEVLGIAYQNKEGVWMAVGGTVLDKANKKITATTTHFSDWGFFERVSITPQTSSVLPSQTVKLTLSRTLPYADLLAPLVPGKEYAIIDKVPLEKDFIKQWHLHGEGQLTPNNHEATYKAPAQAPATNPAVATAELKLPGIPDQLLLPAFINIAVEGISLRIDGGPWIHTEGGMAQYFRTSGSTYVSGYVWEDNVSKGHVEINWKGQLATVSWSRMGGNNFMYRVPGTPLNTLYYEHFDTGTSWSNSPGSLTITKYGNEQEYVSGNFVLEKSGIYGDGVQTVKIEGHFNVKRVADNP